MFSEQAQTQTCEKMGKVMKNHWLVYVLAALWIGCTFALQGPGGMECNTPRECKMLAAKTKALALKKKQEEEAKEQSEIAEQVYSIGGEPAPPVSNPQTPDFEVPSSGEDKIRHMRGHRSGGAKVCVAYHVFILSLGSTRMCPSSQ
jgi:hypothetical protein